MAQHQDPKQPPAAPELIEDGQEEVSSRTAIEHGLVESPPAMGPFEDEPPAADPG